MRTKSVYIGLAVVLVMSMGMLLTACGDDEPVKIGSLMEFTGELSEFGTLMDQGVMLAATQVNEAGGVLGGRQIEVISEDAGTTDVTAVDAARKLVDVDGVSAIVGPLRSSHTQAVARAVTIDGEVPLMSPSATSPTITVLDDNNFVFRTAPSDAFQGVVLANLAYGLGYRSAGALYINDAYGQGLADQFEESFTALGGQAVTVPHEPEQPSYASELAQATANDPDVLVAISFPVSAGVYVREAIESGAADTFLFVDGSKSNDLIDAVGAEHLEGMYGTAPEALENADRAQFDGDYMAAYNNDLSLPFIRESYDAAVIFALAAEAADSSDPVALRDAIRSVSGPPGEEVGPGVEGIKRALELLRDGREINYQGASGPVDVDGNGDVTGAMGIWKIAGGELVTERIVTE